jgi:hypothetical protein
MRTKTFPRTCEGCGREFTWNKDTNATGRFHSRLCYYRNGKRGVVERPDLKAVERPGNQDIAWAAGAYEGEGTCSNNARINRSGRRNRSFRVDLTQKDRWLCDRLRALFGGSVGYHERHRADRPPMHSWRISGTRAHGFALTVYRYLSPRRQRQMRKALGV